MLTTPASARVHSRGPAARWLPQVLSVGAGLCVCTLVAQALGTFTQSIPFPIFVAGIMAVGWYGGFWPALCLTVLAACVLDVLFIHPLGSLAISSPAEGVLLGIFSLVGAFASAAVGTLHEGRRQAEQLQQLTAALSRAVTPGDIAEVVRAQALALLRAPFTSLWVIHGDRDTQASRPVPVSSPELPLPEVLADLAQQALRSGAPVWPPRSSTQAAGGLAVPLRAAGRVLGALALLLPGRARLSTRQRRLVLALGEGYAAALERAVFHERLERKRRLLDAVLEQAPVGVIVAEVPTSRILLYNEACERILGHPAHPATDVAHYARYGGYHADGTPLAAEEYPTARALPHLFERFYRGENVVGRIAGTGLGLFGARQIVEQHGGRIEVRSVEGQGSTFSVWLPLAPPLSVLSPDVADARHEPPGSLAEKGISS